MSSNILGLNNIINKDKINSSIHLKDKEIDMLSNLSFDMNQTNDNNNNNNNNNLYDKDIKDIANEIGINLDNLDDNENTDNNIFNDLKLNNKDFNLNNDDVLSVKSFKTTKTATIPSFNTLKKEINNPFTARRSRFRMPLTCNRMIPVINIIPTATLLLAEQRDMQIEITLRIRSRILSLLILETKKK